MKSRPNNIFKKSPLALGISSLLALSSLPASAVSWDKGDWSVSLDSTFTLGTSIRTEDRDFDLIGKSNLPIFDWQGYSFANAPPSGDVWDISRGQGSYSTNGDLGNLNYDSGEAFSTMFTGVHELDIRYKDMGLFVRGLYFYDFEMEDGDRAYTNPITGVRHDPCESDNAADFLCSGARILDAFFYSDFYIGDMPVSLRIGDQVVSWGESTFIQHGINTTNPVDVTRARAPGAELKEVFQPVGMVFASIGLTDTLSVSAYYQYEWERSILPQAGSYFATNDFVGDGGQSNLVQLNFASNPDINLDFLLSELQTVGALTQAGDTATALAAYFSYATRVAIRGFDDAAHVDADDQGQYGLKVSYYAENLNETEFSLYHINYHSQRPLISGVTSNFNFDSLQNDLAFIASNEITRDNITELAAFTQAEFVYPEDIKLYGFSFNTNVGETALAGEIAYRQDEPLQIDDVELLYMGTAEQFTRSETGLAFIGSPGVADNSLVGISQLNNVVGYVPPGGTAQGFVTSDTMQIQATISHLFGPTLGTDNLVVLGEVGYVDISDFPDPSVVRLNGPGTARTATIEPIRDANGNVINTRTGLHTTISDGPETNPFPTEDAWGYRILVNADFNNVFSGVNMRARATFSHDVDGITPDPLFLFIEDRKSANLSLTFDYLNKWSATASYNTFWGGVGTTNTLSDRDFISFNIKYAI